MSQFRHILTRSDNGVKTITLNRPDKRNALCPLLIQELTQALKDAETCGCGVVILTGAGSAFCAGLDMEHLATLHAQTPDENRLDAENLARLLRTLYEFPKPVIAAVNGPAIAGGTSLATIPDFTLAVPEAKFGFTEVKVGFVPAIAASFLLRQIGEKRTRDLLLSGKLVKAHEALYMGLISQIVNPEELIGAAEALAQCLLLNSPQAMQQTKLLLAKHARHRFDEELEEAVRVNAHQKSAADFREGVQAFLEHRKPEWPSLCTHTKA